MFDKPLETRALVAEASNEKTSKRKLVKLAMSHLRDVREAVAVNPSTPPYILDLLSLDERWQVRAGVAANRTVDEKVLSRLAKDEEPKIKMAVLWNPVSTDKLIETLTEDSFGVVRMLALTHHSFTSVRLQHYALSEDMWIRRGVAQNKNIPMEILISLANDDEEKVSMDAMCILKRLTDEQFYVGIQVFGNPQLLELPREWVLKTLGVNDTALGWYRLSEGAS